MDDRNPVLLSYHSSSVSSVSSAVPMDPVIQVDQYSIRQNCPIKDATQERNLSFEDECQYNIDHQYAHWRTNVWEEPPICIPEALDVIDKCFIRTTDVEATDFGHALHKRKAEKLKAQTAERIVHAAFQTSRVGGILVYDFDMSTLWKNISVKKTSTKKMLDKLKPFAGWTDSYYSFL
jgi:hypothetical protein